MFDIGFSEIILIFGLALVVLGPEKLPKLAATIGRWIGRARAMARQFQDQLETEAEALKSSVNEVKQNVESSFSEVKSTVSAASASFSQIQQEMAQTSIDTANAVSATTLPDPAATAAPAPAAAAPPTEPAADLAVPAPTIAPAITPASVPAPAPAHYEHNER